MIAFLLYMEYKMDLVGINNFRILCASASSRRFCRCIVCQVAAETKHKIDLHNWFASTSGSGASRSSWGIGVEKEDSGLSRPNGDSKG